uniref:Lysine-specific demethylase 2A n=1 Tax=Anthurium amnicola TaxID=1678845 RepID=A0A1D1XMX4_9ARAE
MVQDACSLPKKTYIAIFSYLTDSQLSVASTVCKAWSIHALSCLYRSIKISKPSVWSHFLKYNLFQKQSLNCKELILFSINISSSDKLVLLEHTRDLNHIALLKCNGLDEEFLDKFTKKHSSSLERFTLWGPRTFEAGATTLIDNILKPCLPNLLNVNHLSICAANITDKFLLLLASTLSDPNNGNPSSLIELDLTECWKITAFGVAELFSPNHLSSLRRLRLQYHEENTIDVEYFDFLANSFPDKKFDFLITEKYLKNKVLTQFDNIFSSLDSLTNKKSNVLVVKRSDVWKDNEIMKIFFP